MSANAHCAEHVAFCAAVCACDPCACVPMSCCNAQVSAEGALRAMLQGVRGSRARIARLLKHPGLRPLEVSICADCAPGGRAGHREIVVGYVTQVTRIVRIC